MFPVLVLALCTLPTAAVTEVRLPAVRAPDLPALSVASGGRLEIPARPAPSGTQ